MMQPAHVRLVCTAALLGVTVLAAGARISSSATFDRDRLDQVVTLGGTSGDSSRSVDVDSSGNRYVVGTINGQATFASAVVAGETIPIDAASLVASTTNSEMYLAKYSPDGTLTWVATASATSGMEGYNVRVGPSGEVVVSVRFLGTAVFNSARLAASGAVVSAARVEVVSAKSDSTTWPTSGFRDMAIARFLPSGEVTWATTLGNGTLYNEATSVVVDANGNVYATGHMWSDPPPQPARFRSATSASTGLPVDARTLQLAISTWLDVFLVKFSANGSLEWAAIAGAGAEDRSFAVDVGDDGNPVIAGSYAFSLTLQSARAPTSGNPVPDPGTPVSAVTLALGATDWYECFVAKYSSDGTVLWGARLGASGTDWCEAVNVGPNNRVRVAGQFTNPFTATSATLASTGTLASSGQVAVNSGGGTDLMISSFSGSGALEWIATGGSPSNDHAWSLADAPNGDLVLTSQITSSPTMASAVSVSTGARVDLATMTATHAGGSGTLVSRFDADGRLTWISPVTATGSPGAVSLVDVTVDASNRIIAAGTFSGVLSTSSGTVTHTATASGDDGVSIRWGVMPPIPETTSSTTTSPAAIATTTSTSIAAPQATTTTTSPTTTTSVPVRTAQLRALRPGVATALVNGQLVSLPVRIVRDQAVVQGDGFVIRLAGECARACAVVTVASREAIVLETNARARVSGAGFKAGSTVSVWLYSTPQELGALTVNDDGTFDGSVPLDNIPVGEHTLRVMGLSSDGSERTTSLGVVVSDQNNDLPQAGKDPSTPIWSLFLVLAGILSWRTSRRIDRRNY